MASFVGAQRINLIVTRDLTGSFDIVPTAGADVVLSGCGDETISTGADDDLVVDLGGDNLIDLGEGHNLASTGFGNDTIVTADGNDKVRTSRGDDLVALGGGRNTADLGGGDGTAVIVWGEADGLTRRYRGGAGCDTIRLVFAADEARDPGVIGEVAALIADVEGGGPGWIRADVIDTWFRDFEAVELFAPVVAMDDALETSEDGAISGNVLDNDLDLLADEATRGSNNDALTVVGFQIDTIRTGATLSIAADGRIFMDPVGAYDDLSAGESVTISASYTVEDDQGFADEATVTVTITGTDDAAMVTGDTAGAVAEDDPGDPAETATGAIGVTDVDGDDDPTFANATAAGTYGAIAVNAAGDTWTYMLDQAAVQDLDAGDTVTDTFTLTDSEGNTQTVTVTITGTNDVPTIAGDTTGDVEEDGTLTATGTLSVTDTDTGESTAQEQVATAGSYGTFAITATGAWSYTLDNTNAAVQALAAGATLGESFTVTSFDGTATETVAITITGTTGTNDGIPRWNCRTWRPAPAASSSTACRRATCQASR